MQYRLQLLIVLFLKQKESLGLLWYWDDSSFFKKIA